MDLGELFNECKRAMKRGDALDDIIPAMVRQSARFLERNHTFEYMKIFYQTTTLEGEDPRVVELPFFVKSIQWIRKVSEAGAYTYLRKADPGLLTTTLTAEPLQYWLSGAQNIFFDNTPDMAYNLELRLVRMTSWPTDADARPWLVEMADDLLFAETMRRLSAHVKDDQRVLTWTVLRDEALKAVLIADDEFREADTEHVMGAFWDAVGR